MQHYSCLRACGRREDLAHLFFEGGEGKAFSFYSAHIHTAALYLLCGHYQTFFQLLCVVGKAEENKFCWYVSLLCVFHFEVASLVGGCVYILHCDPTSVFTWRHWAQSLHTSCTHSAT